MVTNSSPIRARSPATTREEIAGLLEGIAPDREMAARRPASPCASRLPLASSTGASGLIRLEAHAIDREHVGPVEEIGDAAETFGLALRAIGRARAIEAHQLGVGGGVEPRLDAQPEGAARRIGEREFVRAWRHSPRGRSARRRCARPTRLSSSPSSFSDGPSTTAACGRSESVVVTRVSCAVERNLHVYGIDQEIRNAIILETNGLSALPFPRCKKSTWSGKAAAQACSSGQNGQFSMNGRSQPDDAFLPTCSPARSETAMSPLPSAPACAKSAPPAAIPSRPHRRHFGDLTSPDWSPDGKWIIFTSGSANFTLWVVPAGGREAEQLVAGEDPCWAPNSRTVIFTRQVNHNPVLSLLDVPTKHVKDVGQISGSCSQPAWAR